MKTFKTHKDKEIQLVICPKTAHIKLKFEGGGELPQELSGLYTTERAAEIDVNLYLDRTKPKTK